jgi:hypothetical protein
VSFDRPYVPGELALNLSWELPFVAFAERSGFSVDYQTDIDTAQDPSTLNGYRLVISLGHDEYWSKEMRDAFEAALARGQNLAFLGADIAEWQIRYDDLGRTVVEYRDAGLDPSPDPATKTTRFRSLDDPRPECRLLGVSFDGGILAYGEPHHDFVVTADGAADPWLAGTGFHAGDVLAASVGFEWDHAVAGCTPPQTVFFHADTPQSPADVIRYRAASGGYVFSTSSLDFLRAIDNYGGATPDPRLQAFLRNALAALSR